MTPVIPLMFPEQTPEELYAELLLSRNVRRDVTFAVVEGDDDVRFWLRFIDRQRCELIPAHGKRSVEECIRCVDADGLPGVLGIVDADLDDVEDTYAIVSMNIIRTPDYDLEALLFQSTALNGVLHEHGDQRRITEFETAAGHDLRDALIARALPFGQLRWLSRRRTITIDRLSPGQFVQEADWTFDLGQLHREIAARCRLDISVLQDHLGALPMVRPWAICQGHDVLHILRIALQGPLGRSGSKRSIRPEQLAGLLRQSFQIHEFQASTLYRDLRSWEARNVPYCVMPPP